MNKKELKALLQNVPEPRKLKETQQMCMEILDTQPVQHCLPEERTGFLQFLSDVMRHIGLRLWLGQGIVLLLVCAGIFSAPDAPNIIPVFVPLFVLACLPSFYQSAAFGMSEIEAVTRASCAQIILAKLILAGAAQLVCLTVICRVVIFETGYPVTLVQLLMYVMVPVLGCFILTLWNMRTKKRYAIPYSVLSCLGVSAFAGVLAHWFPTLYDISAIGGWMTIFMVFAGFFAKELSILIKTWKEGKMYGIIA